MGMRQRRPKTARRSHPLSPFSRKRRRRYPGPFTAIEKFEFTTARSRSRIFAARTARQIPGKRLEGVEASQPRRPATPADGWVLGNAPEPVRRRGQPVRRENRLKSKSSAPEDHNRGDETAAIEDRSTLPSPQPVFPETPQALSGTFHRCCHTRIHNGAVKIPDICRACRTPNSGNTAGGGRGVAAPSISNARRRLTPIGRAGMLHLWRMTATWGCPSQPYFRIHTFTIHKTAWPLRSSGLVRTARCLAARSRSPTNHSKGLVQCRGAGLRMA